MYVIYSRMSLPSFKFTNIGAPTSNERVNSGLSSSSKMEKSGILSTISEKAQDTFKEVKLPDISLDTEIKNDDSAGSDSFFSFGTIVKVILILVILWFMWSSLTTNSDFYLGMGEVGRSLKSFFKKMEKRGRKVISRVTNQPLVDSSSSSSDSDSDSDNEKKNKKRKRAPSIPPPTTPPPIPTPPPAPAAGATPKPKPKFREGPNPAAHRPPVPPAMTNSTNKKPGFVNNQNKYTFLDKAKRDYTGPSPRAYNTNKASGKQNASKAGYCYVGEDRGYRSCVKVEPGDECMSGQIFTRQDVCVNPKIRV